jgi:hypothetical protein
MSARPDPLAVVQYQLVTDGNPRYQDGSLVALVRKSGDGWRVHPYTQDRPSRKEWPTPEQAAARFKRTKLIPCVGGGQ